MAVGHALEDGLDALAESTGFSGVVRVDRADDTLLAKAYGLADRAHGIPNDVGTQFGIASGTKGLTALTVVSLIESGAFELTTPARTLLGTDLPLIGDDVTIEHLLGHTSGIGDYLDEEQDLDFTAYLMPVPVHELATTEQYLPVLEGHATKFPAGERFAYCNGGYVVLALLAERATGRSFHELVDERVCRPAGMADTAFLRSDELPARAAIGYVRRGDTIRSNVFHLPVRGSGDGGVYSTAADVGALWAAAFAGEIVSATSLEQMLRFRSGSPSDPRGYGLGFWLDPRGAVRLVGGDTGVAFDSVHDPARQLTRTVLSNTVDGADAVSAYLDERFA